MYVKVLSNWNIMMVMKMLVIRVSDDKSWGKNKGFWEVRPP